MTEGEWSKEALEVLLELERRDRAREHVEHEAELARRDAAWEARLRQLQRRVSEPEHPRPSVIHPDDFEALPQAEYEAIRADLDAGRIVISEDAPKGKWTAPTRRMTLAELEALPQAEYEKISAAILRGDILIE